MKIMKTRKATIATLAFALVLLVGGLPVAASADRQALQAIPTLDVPRYLGIWYEIAKYPNRFQKHCASNTRAEYRLREDGRIEVINRCAEGDGSLSEAVGLARQVGSSDSPRLKVRFAPAWLSFLPVVWGDYWIIDLDADYQLVAVSEPKREYLWVLSRTPEVDPEAYRQLLNRLEASGFDLDRLEHSPQGGEGE